MNQFGPIGTEIWFRTEKSWDGRQDGMNGCTEGRTDGAKTI